MLRRSYECRYYTSLRASSLGGGGRASITPGSVIIDNGRVMKGTPNQGVTQIAIATINR